jgi:hypothetical protein
MNFNKFLNFDQLIVPTVIKVIYVIASIAVVVAALAIPGSEVPPLLRILMIIGGLFAARLYCELIIVLFKISENVSKIVAKDDATTE